MTPNTLHQYRPLVKFGANRHFIYITARRDESKEELQSYYNMIDEDMEEITKEWPTEFLVPVEDTKLSDADIIGSPLVTWVEHVGQSNAKKKKIKVEVHHIEIDEDKAFAEDGFGSPERGGEDQGNGHGGGDDGETQEEDKATLPQDPLVGAETSQKRKDFPEKPSARKKTCTNKPKMKVTLKEDDVDLIIATVEDALEDILQRYRAKQGTLYKRIDKDLKEIQQSIYLSRAVPAAPSSSKIAELGDKPAQLQRLADATEARLHQVHEEKEKDTKALKQENEEVLEKLRVAHSCITAYEKEKDEIWAMFEEDKEKIQKEKYQLLAEQTTVKEEMTKSLRSVLGLEQEEQESTEIQVGKLVEAIQQLQARITELEIQAVSSTPQ
jgi:hypothetical protein